MADFLKMATVKELSAETRMLPSAGPLPTHRLVRLNAGSLELTDDSSTDAIGFTLGENGSAPLANVVLRSAVGTCQLTASGAISPGIVYRAADGKVAASGTVREGVAVEAAADGQLVRVVPL